MTGSMARLLCCNCTKRRWLLQNDDWQYDLEKSFRLKKAIGVRNIAMHNYIPSTGTLCIVMVEMPVLDNHSYKQLKYM